MCLSCRYTGSSAERSAIRALRSLAQPILGSSLAAETRRTRQTALAVGGAFTCASCFPQSALRPACCPPGSPPPSHARSPPDVTAFDVAGLKSKLMVTALTCNQQDRYNDFVNAIPHRPDGAGARAACLFRPRVRWPCAARARRLHHQPGEYPVADAGSGRARCSASRMSASSPRSGAGEGIGTPGYAASKQLAQPIEVMACPARPAPRRPAPTSVSQRHRWPWQDRRLPATGLLPHAPASASAPRQVVLGRPEDGGSRTSAEQARAPRRRRHAQGDAGPRADARPGAGVAVAPHAGDAGGTGAVGRHAVGGAGGDALSGERCRSCWTSCAT